jgi:hypothetical protein
MLLDDLRKQLEKLDRLSAPLAGQGKASSFHH